MYVGCGRLSSDIVVSVIHVDVTQSRCYASSNKFKKMDEIQLSQAMDIDNEDREVRRETS